MNDSAYITTEEQIRSIARDESHKTMAALAGLVLRRLQEDPLSRDPDRNTAHDVVDRVFSEIFGEVLQEYGHVPSS
jgi:acetyl-CoA carboxylase alpha subunit